MLQHESASNSQIISAYQRKRILVHGSEMAYIERGEGVPVILLHGYPANGLCWRHQIDELAKQYRVIAPDWFGFGESERRFDTKPEYDFEVERMSWILDAFGIEAATIVGHDYGGYLGLGFAARFPSRVNGLCVMNCRAHRTFPQPTYAQFGALCALARTPILRNLLGLVPFYSVNKLLLGHYARPGGPLADGMLEAYLEWMKPISGRRWVAHFFRYYAMPENERLARELRFISCPTHIVWGDEDPYCPFQIAEELANEIPKATIARLQHVNHFIPEERPNEVTSEIKNLLARVHNPL